MPMVASFTAICFLKYNRQQPETRVDRRHLWQQFKTFPCPYNNSSRAH